MPGEEVKLRSVRPEYSPGEHAPAFADIAWCVLGERRIRRGVLIGSSETGLALLTHPADTPRLGQRIIPRPAVAQRPRPARVVRIDHVSGVLDLVAAECLGVQPAPQLRMAKPALRRGSRPLPAGAGSRQ